MKLWSLTLWSSNWSRTFAEKALCLHGLLRGVRKNNYATTTTLESFRNDGDSQTTHDVLGKATKAYKARYMRKYPFATPPQLMTALLAAMDGPVPVQAPVQAPVHAPVMNVALVTMEEAEAEMADANVRMAEAVLAKADAVRTTRNAEAEALTVALAAAAKVRCCRCVNAAACNGVIECGHVTACDECRVVMEQNPQENKCPICRIPGAFHKLFRIV